MKLKFDLEIESLRLKEDFGIDISKADLLEEFNNYYFKREKDKSFVISIPTNPISMVEILAIRYENVIGSGILLPPDIIDIDLNDDYKFFEVNPDIYILSGRWISDMGANLRLISVHIVERRI